MEEKGMRGLQGAQAAEGRQVDDGPMEMDEGLIDREELIYSLDAQLLKRAVGANRAGFCGEGFMDMVGMVGLAG